MGRKEETKGRYIGIEDKELVSSLYQEYDCCLNNLETSLNNDKITSSLYNKSQ